MARIRSTHPGQWTDQEFVECGFAGRLLALALRNLADDSGVFEWKPKQIKMSCFPADSVDIDALLSELVSANIIKSYEIDGHKYGAIRNFRLYQRPKTPNKVHPLTPEMEEYVALNGKKGGKASPSTTPISVIDDDEEPTITETPPKTDQQMEEEGGEMKDEGGKSSLRSDSHAKPKRPKPAPKAEPPGFREFYDAFPVKKSPADAIVAYAKALRIAEPDVLLAGARRYAIVRANEDPTFTKHPATWLNKQCWLDEETTNGTGRSSKRTATDQHLAGIAELIAESRR